MVKKRAGSVGHSIGGIMAGIDGQIFRSSPPVNELVAKGERLKSVAASGGGRLTVGLPDDLARPTGGAPPPNPTDGTPPSGDTASATDEPEA